MQDERQSDELDEVEKEGFSATENTLVIAIVACLYLASVQFIKYLRVDVFQQWISANEEVNARIIWYGFSLLISSASLFLALSVKNLSRSFKKVFLWFGASSLLIVIGVFLGDLIPRESYRLLLSLSGLVGAILFGVLLWYLRRAFFTPEKIIRNRILSGRCPRCGYAKIEQKLFCPDCGFPVAKKCPQCGGILLHHEQYCPACGEKYKA